MSAGRSGTWSVQNLSAIMIIHLEINTVTAYTRNMFLLKREYVI